MRSSMSLTSTSNRVGRMWEGSCEAMRGTLPTIAPVEERPRRGRKKAERVCASVLWKIWPHDRIKSVANGLRVSLRTAKDYLVYGVPRSKLPQLRAATAETLDAIDRHRAEVADILHHELGANQ